MKHDFKIGAYKSGYIFFFLNKNFCDDNIKKHTKTVENGNWKASDAEKRDEQHDMYDTYADSGRFISYVFCNFLMSGKDFPEFM